jgi:transposase-like protein
LPLRLEDRGPTRAFWRSHFEVWELSGLTQREYCEKHGLNLKNFGNWRGQLKREDAVGPKARWGRYPRLRPSSGPSSRPSSERPRIERPKTERLRIEKPAPTVVTEPGRRRRLSEDAKRRIVEETCQPGVSVSRVARQYGIAVSSKPYASYYDNARTHLSLKKDAPFPRPIERVGRIASIPILGGLHHQYCRT